MNNNNFYLKELLQSSIVMISLFFISLIFNAYFTAVNISNKFIISLDNDIVSINTDLRRLQLAYNDQIKWVKLEVEQLEFSSQELNKYFNSRKTSILDRSSIGAIIVSNNSHKIIYSNALDNKDNNKFSLPHRSYLDKVKLHPNSVTIGEIVTGVLTKLPSIPLATGITNKNNEFKGYLIFSINLDNLSRNLVRNALSSVLIKDQINSDYKINSNYLRSYPIRFFIRNIILGKENISFTTFEPFTGKYIELFYNTSTIKTDFYSNFIANSTIVFCLLLLILIFYYFRILRPLQPTLNTISNIAKIENLNNSNIFSLINTAVSEQSKTISLQKTAYQEQLFKLIALTSSVSEITRYIKNKMEILVENVSDIRLSTKQDLSKHQQIIFKELENTVINSEQDIKSLLSNYMNIAHSMKIYDKQEIDIISLLLECGINQSFISVQSMVDCEELALHKLLFSTLIQEIISFKEGDLVLSQVRIEGNRLNFIFNQLNDVIVTGFNEKLIICKIWGLFNNIQVHISNQRSCFVVSCIFS